MIKGVNRKIVEINNTDSIYFEKAVFYLRPNVRELPCDISKAEAEKYAERVIDGYSSDRKRRKRAVKAVVCGIVLTVAIFLMIMFFV